MRFLGQPPSAAPLPAVPATTPPPGAPPPTPVGSKGTGLYALATTRRVLVGEPPLTGALGSSVPGGERGLCAAQPSLIRSESACLLRKLASGTAWTQADASWGYLALPREQAWIHLLLLHAANQQRSPSCIG